uniref:Putative ovule protein n=1 Tax=Solanum chacoense TaxID=4108 RepID=A0A0V0GP69_SOLCH
MQSKVGAEYSISTIKKGQPSALSSRYVRGSGKVGSQGSIVRSFTQHFGKRVFPHFIFFQKHSKPNSTTYWT